MRWRNKYPDWAAGWMVVRVSSTISLDRATGDGGSIIWTERCCAGDQVARTWQRASKTGLVHAAAFVRHAPGLGWRSERQELLGHKDGKLMRDLHRMCSTAVAGSAESGPGLTARRRRPALPKSPVDSGSVPNCHNLSDPPGLHASSPAFPGSSQPFPRPCGNGDDHQRIGRWRRRSALDGRTAGDEGAAAGHAPAVAHAAQGAEAEVADALRSRCRRCRRGRADAGRTRTRSRRWRGVVGRCRRRQRRQCV